jgi:hypothetical protein
MDNNIWLGKIVRMSALGLGSLIYNLVTPPVLPVYNVTDTFILDVLTTHTITLKTESATNVPDGYKMNLKSEYREVDVETVDRYCTKTYCSIKVKVLDVRN